MKQFFKYWNPPKRSVDTIGRSAPVSEARKVGTSPTFAFEPAPNPYFWSDGGQGITKGCHRLYLGFDLLCSTCLWPIAFTYLDETLRKKDTECRSCGLSLAATEVQSSMSTAFAISGWGVLLDLRTLMRRRKHKKRTRAEQTRMIAPIACHGEEEAWSTQKQMSSLEVTPLHLQSFLLCTFDTFQLHEVHTVQYEEEGRVF